MKCRSRTQTAALAVDFPSREAQLSTASLLPHLHPLSCIPLPSDPGRFYSPHPSGSLGQRALLIHPSTIPAKASFAKLLASERKAAPAASGRHKKDISGWASATPTRFNAEGEPISDDDDDDSAAGRGELDVEELQAVLSRGRNKERLTALASLGGQAAKGGAFDDLVPTSGRPSLIRTDS
jgi:hypothetical protein